MIICRRGVVATTTHAAATRDLALVETGFAAMAQGRPSSDPQDQQADDVRDEWESASDDDPETLYAMWYAAVERSRNSWAEMITDAGLDVVVEDSDPAWNKNRRRILVDLLEENLIHLGHVDLLRESIDGRRGHGWPGA